MFKLTDKKNIYNSSISKTLQVSLNFLIYRKMNMDVDVDFSALRVDHMHIMVVILCPDPPEKSQKYRVS